MLYIPRINTLEEGERGEKEEEETGRKKTPLLASAHSRLSHIRALKS